MPPVRLASGLSTNQVFASLQQQGIQNPNQQRSIGMLYQADQTKQTLMDQRRMPLGASGALGFSLS